MASNKGCTATVGGDERVPKGDERDQRGNLFVLPGGVRNFGVRFFDEKIRSDGHRSERAPEDESRGI